MACLAGQVKSLQRAQSPGGRTSHPCPPIIGSIFQSIDWLERMIGRVSGLPFMIGVWEVRTGTLAALLPLLRRSSCLRVIEWADCGVTTARVSARRHHGIWTARGRCGGQSWTRCQRRILSNSPRCRVPWAIDLIHWRTCRKPACCAVHSNSLAVSSTWEDYLQSLERRFRKALRRSWRVFTKENGATFRVSIH
jgi:hypothetical protein